MATLVLIIFIALAFSFCCSLMEACLLSFSNTDLARLTEQRPHSAAIWRRFKADIQKPLATILIINTFANTVGAAISGAQFNTLFGNKWIAIFSIGFSLVVIQWCEILPKTLGVRYNRMIAGIVAVPFKTLVAIFLPLVRAVEFINRPFQRKGHGGAESTVSDIRVLARSAALENLISKEQESLIARSVHLSTLTAADVMIHRGDINIISTSMSLQDGLIAAHLHRHTRFPLADNGDIDRIVGYVNFKDIVGALRVNPEDPSLRGVMRPVIFVKGPARVTELLAKLTRGYQHIAIVQDDRGATVGLVTLEDIIESLVGDLQDEYDSPPDFIVQLSEHRFRVGGNATFRQLKARVYGGLPRGDDLTIDRWIKEQLKGRPPSENYQTRIDALSVKVRRIVRGNIYDCIVERPGAARAAVP